MVPSPEKVRYRYCSLFMRKFHSRKSPRLYMVKRLQGVCTPFGAYTLALLENPPFFPPLKILVDRAWPARRGGAQSHNRAPAAAAGPAPPRASPGKSRRRRNQFARRVLGRLRWNLYQFQEEINQSVAYWADFEFSPRGARYARRRASVRFGRRTCSA